MHDKLVFKTKSFGLYVSLAIILKIDSLDRKSHKLYGKKTENWQVQINNFVSKKKSTSGFLHLVMHVIYLPLQSTEIVVSDACYSYETQIILSYL